MIVFLGRKNCGGRCDTLFSVLGYLPVEYGAGGRNRTGMGLVGPRDFKSLASANFATPAAGAAVAGL
jgi:hypothetical protein